MGILKFVCHSKRVLHQARRYGWLPGARYTNLRDVRGVSRLGFLDIEWENYSFERHLSAAKSTSPLVTVAQDIVRRGQIARILDQAEQLREHAQTIVIVPKARSLEEGLEEIIPKHFVFGYSVPTTYGGTRIHPSAFQRPVHLLGGRPDVQRALAQQLRVQSMDCNRFTLDAAFGDAFDGETFRPHGTGGYDACIRESLRNINRLWLGYSPRS
jgi:hypothetical protein